MNTQNGVKTHFFLLIFIFLTSVTRSQTADTFKLISSAFEEGKPIPAKYTCDSINISPPLSWRGFPEKTKSFALIMDDPDAPMGTWVHWVIYNIPGTISHLEEKKSGEQIKAVDGLNSWNEKGYSGPCPPGGTHQYNFKLYALDKILTSKEGMTKAELLDAMKDHILGETTLTGLFRNY
ncbi:YbhB/YbcL family Raf kinase inhibitor-like protein [Niastella caeni]|uniref:YbhB/YbcL family Raf kinase inhibitor-like protein n=1 Tax=Niastella caeni TaxID=2569763 RepID=A0A4V4H0X1_9BACT|nr:YbhB/YbcL family Raf kinase inhibitor-like protein [Niastella caeni]THU38236.1 YbhB/YbcL family Raf kinase inhibitor-like protein [Niastella caeni]